VLSTRSLIETGASPSPGEPGYATYAYVDDACVLRDPACRAASCEDGNPAVLLQRLGLSQGLDAWFVGSLAPGASQTLAFEATSPARIHYAAGVSAAGAGADDFVAMHVPGDPSSMGADLYDAAGRPLLSVAFQISGYDASSVDPLDGTAASCAGCPPTGSCYVAAGNGTVGGTLSQPQAPSLQLGWKTFLDGRTTDGVAVGDVLPGGGQELVVVTNGDGYAPGNWWAALGAIAILSHDDGSIRDVFYGTDLDPSATGRDFLGFPLITGLGGGDGFVVSEHMRISAAPGGASIARAHGNADHWACRPLDIPGFWGMGPSAGELRADSPGEEIVLIDWAGHVAVVDPVGGVPLNTFYAWEALGDHPYGHAAIGEVDPFSSGQEIVQAGKGGGVWALSVPSVDGALALAWQGQVPSGFAYSSGPALGDIDGDGINEIVVTTRSPSGVYAFDTRHGGGCKYAWQPTSADFRWASPVIGDVDGDGLAEIVALASDATLFVLGAPPTPPAAGSCAQGSVELVHRVGADSYAWFTPILADVVGDGTLDVIAASFWSVDVVDVAARRLALQYRDEGAYFYPSGTVQPIAGGSGIVLSGWFEGSVMRLDTPQGSKSTTTPWTTFMGGNDRGGRR